LAKNNKDPKKYSSDVRQLTYLTLAFGHAEAARRKKIIGSSCRTGIAKTTISEGNRILVKTLLSRLAEAEE
jgi:hypothetical protein